MWSTSWLPCIHCWLFSELVPELPWEHSSMHCLLKHAPSSWKQKLSVLKENSHCTQTAGVCFNLYRSELEQLARMHEALGSIVKTVQTHSFSKKKKAIHDEKSYNQTPMKSAEYSLQTLPYNTITGWLKCFLPQTSRKLGPELDPAFSVFFPLSTKGNTKVVSQGFYLYDKTPWPTATWWGNGLLQLVTLG